MGTNQGIGEGTIEELVLGRIVGGVKEVVKNLWMGQVVLLRKLKKPSTVRHPDSPSIKKWRRYQV